jgi:hypothetical protein
MYVTLRTIILSIVLYACESWSLIMRKKRRMFGNRVLRKIFVAYEGRGNGSAEYYITKSFKAPPDRREIFAAIANPSLGILSRTGTYTATSCSPHTGAKESLRRLRNCSDLFTVAACTVFVAVAANSAGFIFQFRELEPAGDKNVLCRQGPEGRSRQVSFLFRIQSHT